MDQSGSQSSNHGCGWGCGLLALLVFSHLLYVWPAAVILNLGHWSLIEHSSDEYTFAYDSDAQLLVFCLMGAVMTGLKVGFAALNKMATPKPTGRWADLPSAENFEQLEAVLKGPETACLVEFQSKRETRVGRPALGIFSGMFWAMAGLQLGNLLVTTGLLSEPALGPSFSPLRLGLLVILLIPGMWKLVVGLRAAQARATIDERLLFRWAERKIELVDLLSGGEGEVYLPFSKIQTVELTSSRYTDQKVPYRHQLAIKGEGKMSIPMWGGEHDMLDRIKALARLLAERFGCEFSEKEELVRSPNSD